MSDTRYPIPRVHCGARTRVGGSCRQPAMKNGRCRLHGGKSLSGQAHGRYRHGLRTKETVEQNRRVAQLLKESKNLLQEIEQSTKGALS
jgi:hypothetical protein